MKKEKIISILNELSQKSKDYKDGFLSPKECKIKLNEIDNYDSFIFSE
jgi:hypothetical protein